MKFCLVQKNKNAVTELILNRPQVHNAFNQEMIEELIDFLGQLKNDNDCRALVLRANGPSFCAGADLVWMKKMKDYGEEENIQDAKVLSRLFLEFNTLPMPTIGLIQGNAFGGGVGIISCLDLVICEAQVEFALTEVRLGLLPAVISPFVMAKIGQSQARAYFTTGLKFNTEEALRMGLIHKVSAKEDFENFSQKIISQILMSAPNASRLAKDLVFKITELKRSNHQDFQIHEHTAKTIAKVRSESEAQEGMNSLLEKRKPNWAVQK